MPLILRSVKGSNLTPNEADGNFTYLNDLIASVEDNITAGRGIDSITISGNVLTFHMSDSSVETIALPTAQWNARGEWQPSSPYAVNDIVTYFGTLYVVLFAHNSATTFDPGANDGLGHSYYGKVLDFPSVPGREITTSTYTTVLDDANVYLRFTNSSGCAITIDPAVDYPAWTEIHFRDETTQLSGGLAIECPTPGHINPVGLFENASLCNGATITVKLIAADSWDIMGLLLPQSA